MITKSDYVSYLKCGKRVSLPRLQTTNAFASFGQMIGFFAQHEICEDVFGIIDLASEYKVDDLIEIARGHWRNKYPTAILATTVDRDFDWHKAVKNTSELINSGKHDVIFEAAFCRDGCACLVDILVRQPDGSWKAFEVKSILARNAVDKIPKRAAPDSGTWLDDITFQQYVVSGSISVEFGLMCINEAYRLGGSDSFFTCDLTPPGSDTFELSKAVANKQSSLLLNIKAMKAQKQHLSTKTAYCKKCEHLNSCRGPDWGGLFWNGNKFINRQISSLSETDFNKKGTGLIHRRILQSIRSNTETKEELDLLQFNSSDRCIDFESLIHPIPQYENCAPWEHIPFMFVIGSVVEFERCDAVIPIDSKCDPRPFLIDALCNLEFGGRLFHWGAYDRVIIDKLAEQATPPQQEKLRKLLRKMVDLNGIVKNNVYHPSFDFSFSLKKVGPYYSGIQYSGDTNALNAGIRWLEGDVESTKSYCVQDVQQILSVAATLLGFVTFGTEVPAEMHTLIRKACANINHALEDETFKRYSPDFEMKLKSSIIHDMFVGEMARLGCRKGPANGKPDLLFSLRDFCYWIEVKASGKQDWQSHPTDGQMPPPKGHFHILLDMDPEAFHIESAYLLQDAEWQPGSSINGKYIRLTRGSFKRKELVWEKISSSELHCPMRPTQLDAHERTSQGTDQD